MRERRRIERKIMSEMNLTPLIDVMLVLLVIFMITAPLLTIGIKVDLPKVAAPSINDNDVSIVVFVDCNERIFIGDVPVAIGDLPAKLMAMLSSNANDPKIFVKGDKDVSYGSVMRVMGSISSAGFKKVVLVTDMPLREKK